MDELEISNSIEHILHSSCLLKVVYAAEVVHINNLFYGVAHLHLAQMIIPACHQCIAQWKKRLVD